MIGLVKAFVWVFPLKRIYNAPQDKGIQPRGLEIITQPFHEDLSNFFQLCQHTPIAGIHLSPPSNSGQAHFLRLSNRLRQAGYIQHTRNKQIRQGNLVFLCWQLLLLLVVQPFHEIALITEWRREPIPSQTSNELLPRRVSCICLHGTFLVLLRPHLDPRFQRTASPSKTLARHAEP